MDAISFVLGIKSSHLRSAHLRDLVFRGRVLKTSKINGDGSATVNGVNGHVNGDAASDEEDGADGTQDRNDPKSAWVMAVYEDDARDEQLWKRTITNQGASEYRINDRVVGQLSSITKRWKRRTSSSKRETSWSFRVMSKRLLLSLRATSRNS